MKNTLALIPLLALLLTGCKTSSPLISPTLVQQGVATGVSYSVARYTNAVPYLRAADTIICSAANSTNIAPAQIVAAIEAAGLTKTPESVLILNSALLLYIGVWQSYGNDAVNNVPTLKLYLQATCNGIQQGLVGVVGATRGVPDKNWPVVKFQ